MEHVRFLCPQSCGICEPNCADEDLLNCPLYAAHGECTKNPEYMLHKCKMSCGYCSPVCEDSNSRCAEWAKAEQCNADHDFMIRACPVSCGTCFATCADKQASCPTWALEGACSGNPSYMLKECPHSCDVCSKEEGEDTSKTKKLASSVVTDYACADHNATQCQIWNGSDECAHNPAGVIPLCAETCGACTVICHDKKPECRDWALRGECLGDNKKALDIDCPASCGLCAKLYDPLKAVVKDEL